MRGPSEKAEFRLEYDPPVEDAPPAYEEHLEPGPSQSSSSSTFHGHPSPPLPARSRTGSSRAASSSSVKAHEEDKVSLHNSPKSTLSYHPPAPHAQTNIYIQGNSSQNAGPAQTPPLLPRSFSSSSGTNPLPMKFPNPQPLGFAPISDHTSARASPANFGRAISLNSVGLMKGLGATSSMDLLDPPPPSFSRPPQPQFPYSPFPRCTAISLGKDLENGFPSLPPSSVLQPHPFVTHDVNAEDWLRFLGDIKKAGSSTPLNKLATGGGPLGVGVGLMGLVISKAMEGTMKEKQKHTTAELVDHWNHYFFHPRRLDVNLAHGRVIYTGSGIPPEISQEGYVREEDLDSSSDDEREGPEGDVKADEPKRGDGKKTRKEKRDEKKARRKEEMAERTARRTQRRQKRKDEREAKAEHWKLIITFRP